MLLPIHPLDGQLLWHCSRLFSTIRPQIEAASTLSLAGKLEARSRRTSVNSLKSTFTILFLLGVSYGVYRLIHTPDPLVTKDGQFFVQLTPPTPTAPVPKSEEAKPSSLLNSISATIDNLASPEKKAVGQTMQPKVVRSNSTDMTAPPWDSEKNMPIVPSFANQMTAPTLSPIPSSANPIPTVAPSTPTIPVAAPLNSVPNLVDPTANRPSIMTGPLTPVPTPSTALSKADLKNAATTTPLVTLPNIAPPNVAPRVTPPLPIAADLRQLEPMNSLTDLKAVWPIVDSHIRKGEIAQSLKLLSGYYQANISDADRAELLRWLDALAFKVIYSTEHQLSPTPHVVQAGETIDSIAKQWNIPLDLLLNINRSKIPENNSLTPGLELKIVRGPFRAEIDSQRKELTLFLDQYYAGRFPIDASKCESLQAGPLSVKNLAVDSAGQTKLEFANGISVCTANPAAVKDSIQLSTADAKDVFGILTANSQVTVVR